MPALTIIIPTISRPSLRSTLLTVLAQTLPGDEILVLGDGYQPAALQMVLDAHLAHDLEHCPVCGGQIRLQYIEHPLAHDWGNSQKQYGLQTGRGAAFAFIDDDDIWAPGARTAIERALAETSGLSHPHIFRMRYANGFSLWQTPQLRTGNVGTPMIVVPNVQEKLGRWSSRYEGDFDFTATWGWTDDEIVWHEDVIALISPVEAP